MKLKDLCIPAEEYIVGTRLHKRLADDNRVGYFKTDYITPEVLERYEVIVTAHSDYGLNKNRFSMRPPHLKRWFARHAVHKDSKLEGVPVGHQEPVTKILGDLDPLYQKSMETNNYKNLAYMCFRDNNYPQERTMVRQLLQDKSWVTVDPCTRSTAGYLNYIKQMHSHKFTIAPRGNGAGSIRMWDSLVLRSIPISLKAQEMSYFYDLPILFLDSWEQVADKDFLEEKYEEIMSTEYNLKKLTLSYWETRIKAAFHEPSYKDRYLNKGESQ